MTVNPSGQSKNHWPVRRPWNQAVGTSFDKHNSMPLWVHARMVSFFFEIKWSVLALVLPDPGPGCPRGV